MEIKAAHYYSQHVTVLSKHIIFRYIIIIQCVSKQQDTLLVLMLLNEILIDFKILSLLASAQNLLQNDH